MNKIQNKLSETQTFDDLYNIARLASPGISFLGTKFITVEGFEGVLPIDALTKKILEFLLQNPGFPIDQNNHFQTRSALRDCVDRIYDKNDEQVRTANCFTRLLCTLRSYRFMSPNFTPLRWIWREIETGNSAWRSLRNAIMEHQLVGVGELNLYREDNPDYSFWRQLREDFYWNFGVLFL